MQIAVDAMGGDHAPSEIVRGAVEAARQLPELRLLLYGPEEALRKELAAAGAVPPGITLRHAPDAIGMDEEPVAALRKKPESSLTLALRAVKGGEAEALLSAGNTGALVGGAQLLLGPLEGVKRAGFAIPLPTEKGFCTLIDVGANPNSRPDHLLQYAVMGALYRRLSGGAGDRPSIGLLNIGEEAMKGNPVLRETHERLSRSPLNFIGNVEPHKIFSGAVDVVVCDGFIGNLLLKMAEGLGSFLLRQMAGALPPLPEVQKGLGRIFEKLDFSERGGAPLLGVRGLVIKAHGRSKARAITNALRITDELLRARINEQIVTEIARFASVFSSANDDKS